MLDDRETERAALGRLATDPDAICLIYDRYVVRLVRFLQQDGATAEVAWDAAQETFAKLLAIGRRPGTRSPVVAWPWLAATGRNLLRDWARRGRVDNRARVRLGIPSSVAVGELDDLLGRLEADEESRRLLGALDALADEQRGAVLGRVVEELDYAEVAARAGVSEQTVRTRVSRGLRRMRGLLIEGGR